MGKDADRELCGDFQEPSLRIEPAVWSDCRKFAGCCRAGEERELLLRDRPQGKTVMPTQCFFPS